jgi:hypothetical protein
MDEKKEQITDTTADTATPSVPSTGVESPDEIEVATPVSSTDVEMVKEVLPVDVVSNDSESTITSESKPTEVTPVSTDSTNVTSSVVSTKSNHVRNYAIAGLIVVVMGGGLWAILEQQGRVNSNFFASFIPAKPAATVNGVKISQEEYERNRQQIVQSATAQGFDLNNPELAALINEQAIQSLINTELLRQAAEDRNITITQEQIDLRYDEVVTSVGGTETLAVRMAEIGLTEESLRKDIQSELLVTALFAEAVDKSDIEITEEEIVAFYDANGGAEALPPLEEVREEIVTQLRFTEEQERESAFIESLRSEATIVVNV